MLRKHDAGSWRPRVLLHVTGALPPPPELDAERVRCIACRTVYVKPRTAAEAASAVNCPRCGHVSWLAVGIPVDLSPPFGAAPTVP